MGIYKISGFIFAIGKDLASDRRLKFGLISFDLGISRWTESL
jgi:hypothetical protein